MCILNHSALGQLNGSTTAIASPRISQCGEAPNSPKRTNTKPATIHAHGGYIYKASFEACFVDLGCLEKFFNNAVGKQQKASQRSVGSP